MGAGVLYLIATDKPGFAVSAGFASNGYGAHTGVALFVGDWAVAQLWLFWLAPIFGGVLGSSGLLVHRHGRAVLSQPTS